METANVKLGSKTYRLGYGTKALRIFEREAGRPISEIGSNFGVDAIAALLHAGMVYNHPEVTADDVDEMLDSFLDKGGDIAAVMDPVTDAVSKCGWFSSPTTAASTKASGDKPAE